MATMHTTLKAIAAIDYPPDRVVRVMATDDQWRRLKVIAAEHDSELRSIITAALRTSPLTRKAFE